MEKKPKIIMDNSKNKRINDIWTLFETKKEERKEKKRIMAD